MKAVDINYLVTADGQNELPFVFSGTCSGDRALAQQILALVIPSAGANGLRQYGAGLYVNTLGSNFNAESLNLYVVRALSDIKNIIKNKTPSSELVNISVLNIVMIDTSTANIYIRVETLTTTTTLSFPLTKPQEAS